MIGTLLHFYSNTQSESIYFLLKFYQPKDDCISLTWVEVQKSFLTGFLASLLSMLNYSLHKSLKKCKAAHLYPILKSFTVLRRPKMIGLAYGVVHQVMRPCYRWCLQWTFLLTLGSLGSLTQVLPALWPTVLFSLFPILAPAQPLCFS